MLLQYDVQNYNLKMSRVKNMERISNINKQIQVASAIKLED